MPRALCLAGPALGCVACGPAAPPERSPGPDRPNIVLLIADDQDWAELGFMGTDLVRTPSLDRLARQGTVFARAHLPMSRCRPTLASLLSGRWPHQSGLYFAYGEGALDPAGSLPSRLHDAGYATFVGGKYWEGDPRAMGFTDGEGDDANTFVRRDQRSLEDFLDRHAGRRPLFVWWAPKIPHLPYDPPPEFLAPLDARRVRPPPWIAEDDRDTFREQARLLYAMEAWLDDAVGRLHENLAQRGLLESTVFVFLMDNGWSNGRPSKGTPYEAGVRTPIVFTWPGRVAESRFVGQLTSTLDIFPTLLEIAGVEVPEEAAGRSLAPFLKDGGPVAGIAGAGDAALAGRDMLFGAIYPAFATPGEERPERDVHALYARDERWKYVLYLRDVEESGNLDRWRITHTGVEFPARRAGDEELFDLHRDPAERQNLAALPEHAERRDRMRAAVREWWMETGGRPMEGTPE